MKCTWHDSMERWYIYIHSCHGGNASTWWYFSKYDRICTQYLEIFEIDVNEEVCMIEVYVKNRHLDVNNFNYEYLKYIGDQGHIFCQNHNIPLMYSTNKEKICNCGGNDISTCDDVNCSSCMDRKLEKSNH